MQPVSLFYHSQSGRVLALWLTQVPPAISAAAGVSLLSVYSLTMAHVTCRVLQALIDSITGRLSCPTARCQRRCVIDWEDAFRGIAGCDYLYWLTFMENRPFLQKATFGRTDLSPDGERAILVLVVLLKSYLANVSGDHLKHAVSAQVRIAEILDLPG